MSPSGCEEPCFLKKLPKGNTGISFTPREVGEHLVSVKRNGKHITNSPFKIMVNPDDVGDASRVKVSGPALNEGKTHQDNPFTVDTKNAGYGGNNLFSFYSYHSALKLEKSAISKVQKHIFCNFKHSKKSIFTPEKSLKLHFW